VLSGTASQIEKGSPINQEHPRLADPSGEMKHIVTRSVYRLDPKEVLVAQIRQQLMPRP
jgi:hypothetical protein